MGQHNWNGHESDENNSIRIGIDILIYICTLSTLRRQMIIFDVGDFGSTFL